MSVKKGIATVEEFPSKCKRHPNTVCYVCGLIAPKNLRRSISSSENFGKAYQSYFGFAVGNQDKTWAPRVVCNRCYVILNNWYTGRKTNGLRFCVPCRWREPRDHQSDCYFCSANFDGYTNISRKSWKGLKMEVWPCSVSKPVEHCDDYPVPVSPAVCLNQECSDNEMSESESEESDSLSDDIPMSCDEADEYLPSPKPRKEYQPKLISQEMLNDLAREMRSTPIGDLEVLASRLKEWGCLAPETKICALRNRQAKFAQFYKMESDICYCTDIKLLFQQFPLPYIESEWRLFLDSGKETLKAVLLKNGNDQPSVPVAYSKGKESYDQLKKS